MSAFGPGFFGFREGAAPGVTLLSSLVSSGAFGEWDSRLGVTESGGAVTAWANQVIGKTDSFSEASNGPAYNASDANWGGLPSLGFAGAATDTLVSTLAATAWKFLHDGTGGTILVVARGGDDSNAMRIATANAANSGPGMLFQRIGANDSFRAGVTDGSTVICNLTAGANSCPINTNQVFLARIQDGAATEGEIYDQSGSKGTATHGTPSSSDPLGTARISGRATAAGTDAFTGSMVKVAIWNRQITNAEANTLIAQCITDWGLT